MTPLYYFTDGCATASVKHMSCPLKGNLDKHLAKQRYLFKVMLIRSDTSMMCPTW